MMRKLGQPKILLAVLCSAIAFNAHAAFWDNFFGRNTGDDGNPNTVGNVAAQQGKVNATKAPLAKLSVGVVNNTNSTLASAVLKDKNGKILYTSTKGRTCAVGAVCWLRVTRSFVTKGNTFFFYDNKNKLVAAYMSDNVSVKAPLYNIDASMDYLGMYVLSKIRAINPKITYTRVDNDIATTELNATPYQELADYYLDLMGAAKDNTAQEAKIIKGLADQFAKNKVIPANSDSARLSRNKPIQVKSSQLSTKRISLKSSPAVTASAPENKKDSPLCAESLRTSMDALAMIPMIGDAVKTAALTARDASCPSSDKDVKEYMADEFSKVNGKLNKLDADLLDLQNQLKAFEQVYHEDKLSEQQHATDILDNQFNIWLAQYQSALLVSRGADGQQYNTLNELVSSFGSFDAAIAKNPDLKGALDTLYDDETEYQAIVDLALARNFSTTKLNQICGNANNIAGNVLDIRASCNGTVIAMYGKNIILEKQMKYAYNDISKVYALDTRSDKKRLLTIPADSFTNWVASVEQMNPTTALVKPIKSSDPVYNLANNLIGKGFTVTGWYSEADKRYLEVNYTLGGNIIKSKYAYQHPTRDSEMISYAVNAEVDSNIANVMGVPVPERFFTAKDSNGVVKDRNNYGANNAFPWSSYDNGLANGNGINTVGATVDSYPQTFLVPSSTSFALNAFSFKPEQAYNGGIISPNNGFIEGNRKIFALDGTNKYVLTYAVGDFDKIGSGDFFTLMRYTATDGFSYVGAVRTWLDKDWVKAATQCMTNDCIAKSHVGTLGELKFKNGPASVYWGTWKNNQWDLTIE